MTPQTRPHRATRPLTRPARAIALIAAAAAALLLGQITLTATPTPTPGDTTSILLAAAATARTAPEGAYWRLKQLYTGTAGPYGTTTYRLRTSHLTETWVAKNGRIWIGHRQLAARPLDLEAWRRDGSPAQWPMGKDGGLHSTTPGQGTLTRLKGERKLHWSALPLTIKQIEALPADPEALKKRATEAIGSDRDLAGPAQDGLPRTLASLLYELPASPQVRSAAYQALATLPAVQVEGAATDPQGRPGIAVTFPIQQGQPTQGRLIIDPGTSQVLTYEITRIPHKADQLTTILESGWTDTRPSPPSTE
ncbi:CU044_5270 family protein [Nonomuraea sp. NPDC050790]|uniref:CU044_5270 family protein n=1 Tax=Nonomuraea sp. NPDC050790 TaxID=3364371 RepID=UPI0037B94F83